MENTANKVFKYLSNKDNVLCYLLDKLGIYQHHICY